MYSYFDQKLFCDYCALGDLENAEKMIIYMSTEDILDFERNSEMKFYESITKDCSPLSNLRCPLLEACINGNIKIVKFLMKNGVRANHKSIELASSKGNYKIVKLLIKKSIIPSSGSLLVSCEKGYDKIFRAILRSPIVNGRHEFMSDPETLLIAARSGNVQIVKMITDGYLTITPNCIREACHKENVDLVSFMLYKNPSLLRELKLCKGLNRWSPKIIKVFVDHLDSERFNEIVETMKKEDRDEIAKHKDAI